MRVIQWKSLVVGMCLVCLAFILVSCDDQYTMCTSDAGLDSGDYKSAMLCYPCEMAQSEYPAVTLSGGFTNTKEDMDNQAEALVAEGFVVIGVTPNGNNTLDHSDFQLAHTAAMDKLKTLNEDRTSVVYHKIDTDKLGQVGFSMGGGGVMLNAQENTGDIKATVAICPYYPDVTESSFNDVTHPVFIITGTDDTLALPQDVNAIKESVLTGDHDRVLFINFMGMTHFEMYGNMNENMQKTIDYIIAFLKTELVGDASYESVLSGDIQAQHAADGWFSSYQLYEAN